MLRMRHVAAAIACLPCSLLAASCLQSPTASLQLVAGMQARFDDQYPGVAANVQLDVQSDPEAAAVEAPDPDDVRGGIRKGGGGAPR
jgi:hypothetical protein